MNVAIVHDWLVEPGGAENVLKCLIDIYCEAEVFTLVDYFSEENRERFLKGKSTQRSFIQRLPFSKKKYRNYIPFMPVAIEQFDLSKYDLVISSSYAVAKGVITGPDQLHVCYCHSPMRYAWDLQFQYLKEAGLDTGMKSVLVRYLLHSLRNWDFRSSAGVDYFVANSQFIKRRIKKTYRRNSAVLNPPVNINRFKLCESKEHFFLTASRLVPYKKVDLIVESFTKMPDKKLIVVGAGPDLQKIKDVASNYNNIEIKGFCNDEELELYMMRAKAFVFAAEEDFGIVPLEAQACGTPVIAYGKGGALETVVEGRTGTFFNEQSVSAIVGAVQGFDDYVLASPREISEHASGFNEDGFKKSFSSIVEELLVNQNII